MDVGGGKGTGWVGGGEEVKSKGIFILPNYMSSIRVVIFINKWVSSHPKA